MAGLGPKVPTWEGSNLEPKQNQFWNQWSKRITMTAWETNNVALLVHKNRPTSTLALYMTLFIADHRRGTAYQLPCQRKWRDTWSKPWSSLKWRWWHGTGQSTAVGVGDAVSPSRCPPPEGAAQSSSHGRGRSWEGQTLAHNKQALKARRCASTFSSHLVS